MDPLLPKLVLNKLLLVCESQDVLEGHPVFDFCLCLALAYLSVALLEDGHQVGGDVCVEVSEHLVRLRDALHLGSIRADV